MIITMGTGRTQELHMEAPTRHLSAHRSARCFSDESERDTSVDVRHLEKSVLVAL